MAKLTDSQLIILSVASARDDGLAIAPATMTKAAAANVGSSLVARKLMREVKAKPGMPSWRAGEDGRPISLMITKAGQKAIGVKEPDGVIGKETADNKSNGNKGTTTHTPRKVAERRAARPDSITTARAGSKQALVIKMLSAKSGATLDALIKATGWLPHTMRAALTGLRKKGFAIQRLREKDAPVYRIVSAAFAKGAQ